MIISPHQTSKQTENTLSLAATGSAVLRKTSTQSDRSALVGRQGAHCGNVQVAHGKVWVSEHALRCFPEKKFEVRWLAYMLETMDLNQYSVSAAQPGLSVDNLKHLRIAFPPPGEQRAIADQLDTHCCHSEDIAREARKSLSLLEEYRSALITAAATGQLEELR